MKKIKKQIAEEVISRTETSVIQSTIFTGKVLMLNVQIDEQLNILLANYLNKKEPNKILDLLRMDFFTFRNKLRVLKKCGLCKSEQFQKDYSDLPKELIFVMEMRNKFAHNSHMFDDPDHIQFLNTGEKIYAGDIVKRSGLARDKLIELNLKLKNIKISPMVQYGEIREWAEEDVSKEKCETNT